MDGGTILQRQQIPGSSGQPCTAEGAERSPRASESPCPKIPALKMPLRSTPDTQGSVLAALPGAFPQFLPGIPVVPGQELCWKPRGCHQAPSPNSMNPRVLPHGELESRTAAPFTCTHPKSHLLHGVT